MIEGKKREERRDNIVIKGITTVGVKTIGAEWVQRVLKKQVWN